MKSLAGKTCLITGAASGIGRATAIAAGRQRANLVLCDLAADGLERTVAEIRGAGGTVALHRAFDIADFDAVKAFAETVHAQVGSADVVMNVAGISIWGSVDRLEHRHWRKCIEVNLMGPIHVIECFVPPMIRAGRGGHLVNVSSAAGLFGLPWHAAYSASKFGLVGISEVLRFDLEPHGIAVSVVCPGGVDTGLVETVEIAGVDRTQPKLVAMRERFRKHAVTPEKAANAILEGVRAGRYLVFTSPDIEAGYWLKAKAPIVYEQIMRFLNRQLTRIARSAPPG